MQYTKPLADLIEEFSKFPTIGPKSAQRMAFSLLRRSPEQVQRFLKVIAEAKTNIKYCEQCFNLTASSRCEICLDVRRDSRQICVVESVKDLIALERTQEYRGLYHVLGGVISPLDGVGAEDINLYEFIERLKNIFEENPNEYVEIILAIGLSTEGEATMLYLRKLMQRLEVEKNLGADKIRVTRLAHGLPVGADLDYADETTLARALTARVAV